MAVTIAQVEHIAALAKLSFSQEEKLTFTHQFNDILSYIEKLNELDLDQIAATHHILSTDHVTRPDAVQTSLPVEEALANAPARKGPYFSVPKVIGG